MQLTLGILDRWKGQLVGSAGVPIVFQMVAEWGQAAEVGLWLVAG